MSNMIRLIMMPSTESDTGHLAEIDVFGLSRARAIGACWLHEGQSECDDEKAASD